MTGRIVGIAMGVIAIVAMIAVAPDLKRYLKLRSM